MTALLEDKDLADVLVPAQSEDLAVLVDILTDNGKGRLFLSKESQEKLLEAKKLEAYPEEVLALIAHLIRWYGGNTLANLYRKGKGVPYREELEDVVDHLKLRFPKGTPVVELERAVITAIFQKAWDTMSPDERAQAFAFVREGAVPSAASQTNMSVEMLFREGELSAYRLSMGVASAMTLQVIGRGLPFALPGLGALLGPVGFAVTAIWTLADLSAPAYRVTVPCVVQLAYMRQKQLVRACPACAAENAREAKFCSNCGHKF
ncbi:ubiquinol-cytochrome C chaperone family protein [Burkholderia contaminans]|uniref:ubiquinol-cytochrome C chaperone family protein n=1 Tax=Burkholderia contaminans TaxID=488447 RepID=UPI000F57210F|nr:ubiquinol-cytochrome C chaperone family protein [Burkholderia contaminans]RQS90442.1 hypothetical protein DF035_35090 [Burkholderia contaminans]